MTRPAPVAALVLLASLSALAQGVAPEPVEPSELIRRQDLAGREVVVDDRIRYFLESKRGKGYDEFLLKRTDVHFRLPARLRLARPPSEPNARVRAVYKIEDGQIWCDVTALDLLPADPERLEAEVARLRADDAPGRRAWGLWAQRRGKDLNEPKLVARGEALEGEALRIEADRPDADPLALAARTATRPIPTAIRDGLVHRGLRANLAKATASADLEALAAKIAALLPGSTDPKASQTPVGDWLEAYAKEPAAGYREAPEPVRLALDRRLLADAIQKSLEKQAQERPGDASSLAEAARSRLPDRPRPGRAAPPAGARRGRGPGGDDAPVRGRGTGPEVPRPEAGRPRPAGSSRPGSPTAASGA